MGGLIMSGDTVITVIGNLTADPELRFTPSGAAVANFTVASTPRAFDRQANEWKDQETLFMRCSVWREAAENVAESLRKGTRVIVQGRLKARSYETKEGDRRTTQELEVDEIGPSMRYATAQVTKSNNQGSGGGGQGGYQQGGYGGGPQGGFGGPQQGGFAPNQGGGFGGYQQGGYSGGFGNATNFGQGQGGQQQPPAQGSAPHQGGYSQQQPPAQQQRPPAQHQQQGGRAQAPIAQPGGRDQRAQQGGGHDPWGQSTGGNYDWGSTENDEPPF